jgi:hypothetical protein
MKIRQTLQKCGVYKVSQKFMEFQRIINKNNIK